MCGRFNLSTPAHVLARIFGLIDIPALEPHFNIAPTQMIAVIRAKEHAETTRQLEFMHWGLIPSWAKDPAIGNRLINARSETLAEKPAYRHAFKRRRGLIPADGFYEWKKLDPDEKLRFGFTGRGLAKQPVQISLASGEPLAFAGLWEHWQDPAGTGTEMVSCTIITTEANELLKPVNDRMPVIVKAENWAQWLHCDLEERDQIEDFSNILRPYPADEMQMWFVSQNVNSLKFDSADCISPITKDGNETGCLF